MRDLKVLRNCLKGRRKIVEALLVVFMITGSIQSFGAKGTFISNGPDDILVDKDMTGDVFGDFIIGDLDNGSIDTITIENGITITRERTNTPDGTGSAYYSGNVYGEYASGNIETGVGDIIVVKDKVTIDGSVYGERSTHLDKGGDNTITISDSSVGGNITGSYALINIREGGDDTIKVENNSTVGNITGERASNGEIEIGGNDIIEVSDSIVNGTIYGEYGYDGIKQGGIDKITLTNSTINDSIYGEYIYEGEMSIGGDDAITLDNTTVDGEIYGDYIKRGEIVTGGNNIISVKNKSNVNAIYGERSSNLDQGGNNEIIVNNSTVANGIVGSSASNITTGGNAVIKVENNSTVGNIFGESVSRNLETGGSDIIKVNDSKVTGEIYGEYSYSYINQGGDDEITLTNSTLSNGTYGANNNIYGERVYDGEMSIGGDDIITLDNSTVDGEIYGDYIRKGKIITSGNNIISVENSSNVSSVYGTLVVYSGSINQGGSDKITINNSTVTNKVVGSAARDITTGGNAVIKVENNSTVGDIMGDQGTRIETGGEDEIIISDSTVEGYIYGEYATEDIETGGIDYITLDEGSTSSTIYGEYAGEDIGEGGADVIILNKATTTGKDAAENEGSIFGEYAEGGIGKGGADSIEVIDYEETTGIGASIFGEYAEGDIGEGGADEISIVNSTIGMIYGEFSGDNIEIASGDIITVNNSNLRSGIAGEMGNTIGQGGDDIITLTNQSTAMEVHGDYGINLLTKGGMDKIIVDNSTINFRVSGDYGGIDGIKEGGIDTIIIKNSSSVGEVYGEYSVGDIELGGADVMSATDSTIGTSIYGEYAEGTITTGGDDTFTLIGATAIGGKISGGEDMNGIVEGDYDTINLSSYTTDFTTLKYEGIEEVNLIDNTAIDLGDGTFTSYESEIFNVESGSSITADNGIYTMETSLSNNGVIDLIGDSSSIVGDEFTINGDFSGDSGVIDLDMDAMDLTSDMIIVKGDFTGTQLINPSVYDIETEFDQRTINFMEVEGVNNGQIGFVSLSRSNGMITKGRVTGSPFEWEINDKDMTDGSDMWYISTVQGIDATLPPSPERPIVVDPTDPSTPDGGTDSGTGDNTGGGTDGGGSSGGGEIVVLPELPAYASLQNIGEDMVHSNIDSLYTRLGDIRRYKAENEGESLTKDKVIQDDDYMELSRDGVTVWTRAVAEYLDYEANGDSYGYDGDVSGFDIGADYTFELSRDTAVVAGLFYGKRYGNFETSTSDEGRYTVSETADIDMDSWSLAAYSTFIYKDNTYLDLVAGYTDYESDIDSPGVSDSVDGDAIWGSAEVGHSFQIGDIWRVEPQIQVTYTEVDFDDSTNDVGTKVEYTSNNQLTGRIGTIVSAGIPINNVTQVRPWFGVSVLQEFMDPEDVTYGGFDFETQDIDTYMEYKIGVQVDLNKSFGMYVEGKYQTDYDDYDSYRGTLGVKYSF